ncbi:hypothetical protein Tco_1048849 [Tanacetum coccineum]
MRSSTLSKVLVEAIPSRDRTRSRLHLHLCCPRDSCRCKRSGAIVLCETTYAYPTRHCPSPDHQDPRWSCGYNRGTWIVTYGDFGVKEIHNTNLVRQVALGSQLRLRFEQEVRLLKKAKAQVARHNERIHIKEEEIKRLGEEVESLKAVETELESLRAKFSNIQLNNNLLSQRVSTLQAQVMGEERIQTAFEEFKKYKDDRVEKRCSEMDACLDAMSIDFDEELYPHMLTAIAGHRWVIGHDLRLAVMKCAEFIELRQTFANVVSTGIAKGMSKGLAYGVKQGDTKLDLAAIEAYDAKAGDKTSRPYMP